MYRDLSAPSFPPTTPSFSRPRETKRHKLWHFLCCFERPWLTMLSATKSKPAGPTININGNLNFPWRSISAKFSRGNEVIMLRVDILKFISNAHGNQLRHHRTWVKNSGSAKYSMTWAVTGGSSAQHITASKSDPVGSRSAGHPALVMGICLNRAYPAQSTGAFHSCPPSYRF